MALAMEKSGCGDMSQPWRFDPMHQANGFRVDSHNAHSQSNGAYHYHGKPNALFDDSDDSAASPVIGFAADGYPIFWLVFRRQWHYSQGSVELSTKKWSSPELVMVIRAATMMVASEMIMSMSKAAAIWMSATAWYEMEYTVITSQMVIHMS